MQELAQILLGSLALSLIHIVNTSIIMITRMTTLTPNEVTLP